jgi:hypothetical protein
VNKISSINVFIISLILFSINPVYATNHDTSIFSDSINRTNSNPFKDVNHNFSIQPPPNWIILNNLPANVSSNAIVVFSNNDHNQLATFGIYHRSISQNVINLLNIHSEKDILTTMEQEMSTDGQEIQTVVLNGVVDKYTDGIRVAVNSVTQYKFDNSTSISENIIYFLNSGDQYTLSLTSNPSNFDKNSKLFENSANSFLVSQTSPIPEFSFSFIILVVSMFAVIFISRINIVM